MKAEKHKNNKESVIDMHSTIKELEETIVHIANQYYSHALLHDEQEIAEEYLNEQNIIITTEGAKLNK